MQYASFCWKNSYGRGVGRPLHKCPEGKTKIGALCYSHCREGYTRWGFDCHQNCPPGWLDEGLFCKHPGKTYGRGAGFPWKFGDPLNDSKMFKRCEEEHGKGNCEKHGLIVYPKCKDGYFNDGCCLCRPKFDCGKLGMGIRLFNSCGTKLEIGDPTPMKCNDDEDENAGLCYKKCKSGYKGVGKCGGLQVVEQEKGRTFKNSRFISDDRTRLLGEGPSRMG